MQKIIYTLIFTALFGFSKSQKLHVTYKFTTPLHAQVREDLYINGNNALDIRDSVFIYEKLQSNSISSENGGIAIRSKNKMHKEIYYKSSLQDTILMKSNIGDQSYWIKDTLPALVWDTNYTDTKIIQNYKCKKATTIFRGSSIIAYYTLDIPYPFGPFKFGGLPGLILEIGEEDQNINTWQVQNINKDIDSKIEINKPQNIKEIIPYKDFEQLTQAGNRQDVKKLTGNLPQGTIVSEFKTVRKGIEKKYEWE